MSERKLPHIIAYDIANPKRLGRVHRFLKKQAVPLQYSVFLVELNERGRKQLMKRLEVLIHPKQDDVRIYPLPSEPQWCGLGRALWDEGVMLEGLRLPPLLRYRTEDSE